MNSQKNITIVSISVAIVCIILVVFLVRFPFIKDTQVTPSSDASPSSDVTPVVSPVSFQSIPFPTPTAVVVIQDPGVSWLSKPIKIQTDLSIFKQNYSTYGDGLEFYKVGSQDGKDLIIVLIHEMGTASYPLRKEGTRYALITNGREYYANEIFLDSVYVDNTTKIQAFVWPEKIETNGIKFEIGGYGLGGSYFFDDNTTRNWNHFANTSYGPMYYDTIFAIKSPFGARMDYRQIYDFMTDDKVALFKWNNGKINSVTYAEGLVGGCGSIFPKIATLTEVNGQVFQSGTTNSGEQIYEFVDINHPVVQEGYANTSGKYYKDGKLHDLSHEEYYSNHGVVIYRDKLGRFVAFFNGMFAPQAECGKPVIYLYPEKPTQVTVKAGADIRISEPEYGNGWNVLAEPTGVQTLFWEGLGHGPYPEIKEGIIVKRENLEATLWSNLKQLGANQRESEEFMEFWLDKMPITPYTRLTWFGTKEMDVLAPLFVWPKPDTSIRIFLDYEGLNNFISIPKQKLTTIPRKGFVLFEWGGLLRH